MADTPHQGSQEIEALAETEGAVGHTSPVSCDSTSAKSFSEPHQLQEPKYPAFVSSTSRLISFSQWAYDSIVSRDKLVEAGFFYDGYADCVTCFCCGLKIRDWSVDYDPVTEHIHLSPDCAFVCSVISQTYIAATVTVLGDDKKDDIGCLKEVDELRITQPSGPQCSEITHPPIRNDPGVKALVDEGYEEETVCRLANEMRNKGQFPEAHLLHRELRRQGYLPDSTGQNSQQPTRNLENPSMEQLGQLIQENRRLRQQTACKICQQREHSVCFLPCGHLVACVQCSDMIKNCPVCGEEIKERLPIFYS